MFDRSSSNNNGTASPHPVEGGAQGSGSTTGGRHLGEGAVEATGVSSPQNQAIKSMSQSQSSAQRSSSGLLSTTANPFVPTAPTLPGQTGSYNTSAVPFVPSSVGATKVAVGSNTSTPIPSPIGASAAAAKLQKTAAPFVPTFTPAVNTSTPLHHHHPSNTPPSYTPNTNTNIAAANNNSLKSTAAPFTPGFGGGGGGAMGVSSSSAGALAGNVNTHEDEVAEDPNKITLTRANLQSVPFSKVPLDDPAAVAALAPPTAALSTANNNNNNATAADAAAPNTPKSPRSLETDNGDDEDAPVKLPQGAYKEEANRINDIVVSCWERGVSVPAPESPTFNVATSQSAHSTPPTNALGEPDPQDLLPPYPHPQSAEPMELGLTIPPASIGPQRLNSDDPLLLELKQLGGYTLGMSEGNRPEWMCLDTFAQGHVVAFATDTDGCLALMDVLKESVAPIWEFISSVTPVTGKVDAARHFSSSSKTASQRDAVIQSELKTMSAVLPQIEDIHQRDHVIAQLQAVLQQLLPDLFQFADSAFSSRVVQFFVDTHFAPFLITIVMGLQGHCFQMAKSGTGSRILRSLLEFCGGKGGDSNGSIVVDLVVGLMTELDAIVATHNSIIYHCIQDHYANHVLQCALMNIPGGIGVFMARRLAERFLEFAVHPYGARVIQSLFEEVKYPRVSFETEQAALRLMVQAFRNLNTLINNQNGSLVLGHALLNAPRVEPPSPSASGSDAPVGMNYVNKRITDFSSIPFSCGSTLGDAGRDLGGRLLPIDRNVVCEFGVSLVFMDVIKNARAKYGSVVVQRAIESASMETVQLLTEKLLQPAPTPLSKILTQSPHANPDSVRGLPDLAVLVMDAFGNVACQTLFMRLPHPYQTLIISSLKPYMPIILHAKGGKVFIKKVAPELLTLNTLEALHLHMGYTGGVRTTPDMTVRVGVTAANSSPSSMNGRRVPGGAAPQYDMYHHTTTNNNSMGKKNTPKAAMHDMPPPMYGSNLPNRSPPMSVGGGAYGPPNNMNNNNQGHMINHNNNITRSNNSNSVAYHNNNNNSHAGGGGGGDTHSGVGDANPTDLALELLKQEHNNRLLQQQLQFQQMLMQQQTMFMNMQPSSTANSAGGGVGGGLSSLQMQMLMMQNPQMFNGMGGNGNIGAMGNSNTALGGGNTNNNINAVGGPSSVVSGGSGGGGSTTTDNNNNNNIGMGANMFGGGNMFGGSSGLMSGMGGLNGMNFNNNMGMNFNNNNNNNNNGNNGNNLANNNTSGNNLANNNSNNNNNGMMNMNMGGNNFNNSSSSTGFNAMSDFNGMNFNMGMNANTNNNTNNNTNMFGLGTMNSLPFGNNNNNSGNNATNNNNNNNTSQQQVWSGAPLPSMSATNERRSSTEPLSTNNNWIQSSPLPQTSSASGSPVPTSTPLMFNNNSRINNNNNNNNNN